MKSKLFKFISSALIFFTIFLNNNCNVYATYADYYTEGNCKENGVYVNNKHEKIEGVLRRGIDVSSAQGKIDWDKVSKDDVSFAYIKAGSYMSGIDSTFTYNIKEAKKNGIDTGIYVYTYAHTIAMAEKEAEFAIKLAKIYNPELPIAFDIEDAIHKNLTPLQLNSLITTFCNTVRKAGFLPIVYSSRTWLETRIPDIDEDLWVAQYNDVNTFSKKYSFWQVTSHGKIDGIEGRVDIDFQFVDYNEEKEASLKAKNDEKLSDGFYTDGQFKYYKVNGINAKGLVKIDGNLYCFDKTSGAMYTNTPAEIGNVLLSIDANGICTIVE